MRNALIWVGTLGVMALVTYLALHTPLHHTLFPELAALCFGLLSYPQGHWAQKPWAIAVTPTLAGILGILISRWLGFSPLSVALTVAGTLLILAVLRSSVAPALSAGLLAVVLGLSDPLYPVAVLAGGLIVMLVHALYARYRGIAVSPATHTKSGDRPQARSWRTLLVTGSVIAFAAVVALLAQITGLRFLLFPPLVVLVFEMLDNPACPWAGKPLITPLACLATSSVGLLAHHLLGVTVLGVVLAVAGGLAILSVLRLHMPPALAVCLLPFVMHDPTWAYALSVTGGTILAVIVHALWCRAYSGKWMPALAPGSTHGSKGSGG